jgi:hypothetical protein
MTEVTLKWYEVMLASDVGRMRKVLSMKQNRHGASNVSWTEDIEGACAEMAVAKHLGMYWSGGVDTFKAADVHNIQVRWTPSHTNSLIVRDSDANEEPFVLVTGQAPTYRIHGWLWGRQAKQPQYRRRPNERPSAYFVPSGDLHHIDYLKPEAA